MDQIANGKASEPTAAAADTRLIERWLPIAALGEESVRERRSLQALPPIYYLHVWWARRPLVASRAAVLAAVLPADVDRAQFMHAMGIHGDPVEAKRRIAVADRKGERLGKDAYGYPRAFSHTPDPADRAWMADNMVSNQMIVLDPTAGGGAIPFEAARLGFAVLANDLNPVAALIEKATIEYPLSHGAALRPAFEELGAEFTKRVRARLHGTFPEESEKTPSQTVTYGRVQIRCPYCEGLVPLAPNWRLAPDGNGVRLRPYLGTGPGDANRRCDFIIVSKAAEQSAGTVADGDGTCPFPDCNRVIGGDKIKEQAQSGRMSEQLFVVVVKRRVEIKNKAGKPGRAKWVTDYRAPSQEDGVDPVSWTPEPLRWRSPPCRDQDDLIHLNFAARWSSWCMPAALRRSWRVSSSQPRSRSATGLPRLRATPAVAMAA